MNFICLTMVAALSIKLWARLSAGFRIESVMDDKPFCPYWVKGKLDPKEYVDQRDQIKK